MLHFWVCIKQTGPDGRMLTGSPRAPSALQNHRRPLVAQAFRPANGRRAALKGCATKLCSPMRPVGTRDYGAVRDGPRRCNGNGTVTPFCSRRSSDNVRTLRKRTVPGGGETVRLLRLMCCATVVVLAAAGTAAAQ